MSRNVARTFAIDRPCVCYPKVFYVPARVSEAFVLRTFPLKEADLVVSFLSRDQGKLRGVARRARKPKSAFGSGLERLSHVRMSYFQTESRELVSLDSCELIHSQFRLASDYAASVALDFIAEVTDQLLPSNEPSDRYFRLMAAVLEHLRADPANVWRVVAYFSLWAARLSGFLPELNVCLGCGAWLHDVANDPTNAPDAAGMDRAWYSRSRAGLVCGECRQAQGLRDGGELTGFSRLLAEYMLRNPITDVLPEGWPARTAIDLRRFLVQQIETHLERKLATAPLLEAC
ncbi:MAG: DNA repair protein RecO [Bryobacterales bacterium]|nr:DNA repair protein RecO [Bryobacterales bacterium]